MRMSSQGDRFSYITKAEEILSNDFQRPNNPSGWDGHRESILERLERPKNWTKWWEIQMLDILFKFHSGVTFHHCSKCNHKKNATSRHKYYHHLWLSKHHHKALESRWGLEPARSLPTGHSWIPPQLYDPLVRVPLMILGTSGCRVATLPSPWSVAS